MSKLITNLIPTSKILELEEVLQGYLTIENIKIVLGSGLQSNFNPQSLVKELKNIDVKIESIVFKRKNFSFLFTIKLKQVNYQVNEIGLFWLSEDQPILIAYRSDKNLIHFGSDASATLELVLPYSKWNQQIDTAPAINLPSGIYTETPDDLENISDFFDDVLEPQQAPVNDRKLNFLWTEVIKTEMPFSEELSLIAFDRHPKKNVLLFLYEKKNDKDFFFNTYNVAKQEFKKPILSMKVKQETSERYGIFGKVDNQYIRCYQSHPSGVFCIGLSLTNNKSQKSYVKQQYHSAYVKDNTTLFKLGTNAALGGGDYTGFFWEQWNTGTGFSASGVLNEAWQCLVPTTAIDDGTDNPLIDYIPDEEDEKGKVEVIGGLREPKPIETKLIEEEITEEEITEEEKVTKEEVTKEEVTREEKKKEETREETREEKITKEEVTKEEVTQEEKTKEETREETKEEKVTKEVIIEEIIEEIVEEIVEEEIIEEEEASITEENTVNQEILYAPKPKTPRFIILNNKGVEKKIKIQQSPIQTVLVNNRPIKKENFTYFSTLKPQYNTSEIYKFETITDFNDLLRVNALTHMLCRVENITYIFPRNMFKDELGSRYAHEKFWPS